jgi:hypothetical protein
VTADLSGKRVLLLGAETELGRAIVVALADAGARVALVGSTNDSETAFEVKRRARKVGAEVSQAIDATNEMAVRVMVRQVSKALGGLDGVVDCTRTDQVVPGNRDEASRPHKFLFRFAGRELLSNEGGCFLIVKSAAWNKVVLEVSADTPTVRMTQLIIDEEPPDIVAQKAVQALAAPAS